MIKFFKKLNSKNEAEKRKYTLTLSDPVYGDVQTEKKVEVKNEYGIVTGEQTVTETHHQIVDWVQKEVIRDLVLKSSPGSNKYDEMLEFIEDMSMELGTKFDDFYIGTIRQYEDSNYDHRIIENAVNDIIKYCDEYIEKKNINFEAYINKSKASKSSIFFDADEIKEIIKSSSYLKVYYSIHKDLTMKLGDQFNKEIFQRLVKNLTNSAIILKLHKIVSSKTYEYNHTDKFMWEYIKNLCCKTPDMHISHIFNFIINNIIITCKVDANPIPYLISVIDESIKWVLRSIYKESIIYSDAISTQDVAAVSGKDNLNTYAYNNTISKLALLSYHRLDNIFNAEEKIEEYKTHIDNIKEHSVIAANITFPIMYKITDIPYRHFLTLPIATSYLLSMLLYSYLKDHEIVRKYPTLIKSLTYYNTQKPIVKTTYKLKQLTAFTKTFDSFLGFKNYTTPYDIYSSIIGKINKNEYVSFVTGNPVPNFPSARMETEIIEFYNSYFSGALDPLINELRDKIDLEL